MDPSLYAIEHSPAPDPVLFSEMAFSRPETFAFLEHGYIAFHQRRRIAGVDHAGNMATRGPQLSRR